MRSILTVAVGREPLVDPDLVQPIVKFLAEYRNDAICVIVALSDLEPAEELERGRFMHRLSRSGIELRPATLSDVPQIGRARQAALYFIQPDLASPRLRDIDAIRVAAKLRSHAVIMTKNSCVESADSPLVEGGDIVEHLSFAEMLEIAHGSGLPISAEAVEQAWLTNTPFKIFALQRQRWTAVTHDTYEKRVRSVASLNVCNNLIFVKARRDERDFDVRVTQRVALATLARQGIRIEQVRFAGGLVAFACDADDATAAVTHLSRRSYDVEAEPCVRICVTGSALRAAPGVMHTMLETLEAALINPLHVSDSAVTISILVRERDAQRAEYTLRASFVDTQSHATPGAGHFAFDATTRVLRVRDRSEKLGIRQAKLLHLLMQNVGQPIAIESAAQALFGSSDQAAIAAVRVHVHNIRKKIEDDPVEPKYILTVPNRGYTFARQWGASLEHDDSEAEIPAGGSQAS
jgi:DNA-binding winged helix-turn-helix (wHTH) protein